MSTRLLALVIAALMAGCTATDGAPPGAPPDGAQPTEAAGPEDLTAYLAIAGVTCPI